MADGMYVSMTGMSARADELDSIADNLANAQTPGFKAARPAFESFLPPGGAPDKVYAAPVSTGIDLRPGQQTRTGNPLDVLPEGDSLLAVHTASGGTAFTRAGRLTLDADGRLTAAGRPLLDRSGDEIAIPPETGSLTIAPDGTVTADAREVGQIGLWKVQGGLERQGTQLLTPAAGAQVLETQPDQARLRIGELELANYSALEATVQMVGAQRHFETSMQAMQTYRRLDDRVSDIGRVH